MSGDFRVGGSLGHPDEGSWNPDGWWSTTNLGEALPGALTPLTWSFSGPGLEASVRRAFAGIGALTREQSRQPEDTALWCIGIFGGRVAVNVDFLGAMADCLPGTSGAAFAEQFFGELPEGFVSVPTRRRYPVIAARFPYSFAIAHRSVHNALEQSQRWWQREAARAGDLSLGEARALFVEASRSYEDNFTRHNTAQMVSVQPLFEQVQKLATAAGMADRTDELIAGSGSHTEVAVVEGLWKLSRDEITIEEFLADHGCHGPGEGELASHSWREDPGPVHALCEQYRARPDAENPIALQGQRAHERVDATRALIAALPAYRRAQAWLTLALAARYIPLRGVGKAAALRSIDVGRAAARRIGEHLAAAGSLASADDVFYLTGAELGGTDLGEPLARRVAERRVRRDRDLASTLPISWRGKPERISHAAPDKDRTALVLNGYGACSGIVEGPVRVLLDPDFDGVEDGEILVAPFTDPGWASVMFVAAALVVDIGGMQSHAAVVARELRIPCVMGTTHGTRLLRSGDICRVDGRAGTVTMVRPVGP